MIEVAVSSLQASEVHDIDLPIEYSNPLRRADEFTKVMAYSTFLALKSAPKVDILPDKIGIFLGTVFGPLETNFRFLDSLLDDGEGQASPTLFSHSVHNAAAGYLTRLFKVNGPAITLSSYSWPFLTALQQAYVTICSGVIDRAIVVTGEMYSPVLGQAAQQIKKENYKYSQTGAVTWILDKTGERKGKRVVTIDKIEIMHRPCEVTLFLTRRGEDWLIDKNGRRIQSTGLLSYAFSLTSEIQKKISCNEEKNFYWSINAPFGQANLLFAW